MAEYFIGPVMEKLIDSCYQYLKDQVSWKEGMEEELQKLRHIHPQIQAVISASSQVEIKEPNLENWLWQLRDAIDEADDVLDEFEYLKRDKEVRKERKISKVRSLMKSLKKRFVKICKYDPYLKRLEKAVRNLCKVSDNVSTFLHLLEKTRQEQQQQIELHENREEGAMPTNDLLGRSEEMEFIRHWLRSQDHALITDTDYYSKISVLSVVGHGGMGKTTLLQHIYSDGVLTEEFDVKMWACVSTNFNVKTLIKNILESSKKERPPLDSLAELQNNLKSEVTSKRFLLVLDDIWEDDEPKWEKILAPLHHGSLGSKILITTRMDSVASMFAKLIKNHNETLRLKGLEENECLRLLNTHAFAGAKNIGDEFRYIARKMVEKLSGSPLAAKVIGKILNAYMDEGYWRNVLNTNIGKVEPGQNHLIPILKLSYIYLPIFLKNCFTFCCIFPQDHEFDKDDLIRMWIALGFIQSSDIQGETLKDIGRRYFNILVQKSFFDEFRDDDKVFYKMHDLLHELAQTVSKQECLRVVDDENLSIPPKSTIRHLSIDTKDLEATFKKIGKLKSLRSLFLPSGHVNVISEILEASKHIRLLVIYGEVPETVNCLIHLRYLRVESPLGLMLTRSIRHLYHLQFMISKALKIFDNIGWKELMPNKNCQLILDTFGWKAWNRLQGDIRDCSTIYIQNSPNLIHLTGRQEFKFNENFHLITDKLVINDPSVLLLEPLRSISSLRFLTIEKNNLLVYFTGEMERMFLQHLSSLFGLRFEKLKSLQSLPCSLQMFSSLNKLYVYNVPKLKFLPDPPASLRTLLLYNLKSLLSLPFLLSPISSLKQLDLKDIPLLKSLPDLPSSLINLDLENLKSLECLPSSLSAISSLKTLELRNIPLLKSLPDLPPSLLSLSLINLENLDRLPSCLPTLNELTIIEIPRFLTLPKLPSSLKELKIKELESLLFLPSSLSDIPSLTRLALKNIPLLKSLPDLPPSLLSLFLINLENLDRLPSCLPTPLNKLKIIKIPRLLELPELPASLKDLIIEDCHPQLKEGTLKILS